MTNYAKKHPYFLTALFIAIAAIIMLALGFRLQPNMTVSKNGTLEVTFPLASTTLYVDNKKVDTAGTAGETIVKSLSVKTHSVIVARAGYLPWTKEVAIRPNETTVIKPIFVTQNATGQIITKNDKDYWTIRNKIQATKLPTVTNSLKGPKEYYLFVENNTIYVAYVKEGFSGDEASAEDARVTKVITPKDPIHSVDFYADRTDVIVFASDSGVYALEVIEDAANNKANFLPIYTGTKPIFLKTDPSFLYVLDGENLLQVVI